MGEYWFLLVFYLVFTLTSKLTSLRSCVVKFFWCYFWAQNIYLQNASVKLKCVIYLCKLYITVLKWIYIDNLWIIIYLYLFNMSRTRKYLLKYFNTKMFLVTFYILFSFLCVYMRVCVCLFFLILFQGNKKFCD